MGPHVLKDLIEPGTSQGTHPLNPWQAPEPMITTHLKRDNERKMGVGGLGQPTESADASFLAILLTGVPVLKPCEIHHHKLDLCWMDSNPNGTIYGDE